MERLIKFLLEDLDLMNNIAPVIALLIAVLENKFRGWKDCFIVALMAIAIAGIIENYLPTYTFFLALLVGIISGVFTDDLYTRFTNKFPNFIDDVIDVFFEGVKTLVFKIFGDRNK